jgi:hypothetical protein
MRKESGATVARRDTQRIDRRVDRQRRGAWDVYRPELRAVQERVVVQLGSGGIVERNLIPHDPRSA